ncbi:uncharacterized protein NEMAJ01_1664 [Nematocida major]|uniref:uncharacterized protein n=1 Tax=Nematocida major TaxID=1912982 RepID=UPI002007F1B8|nr:uncharacterized protein NEMAJ01_1664 [Nematocida major]KAH9386768.1 hypothetical protein NEMAJ01_1664 [Nematocida major]
MRANRMACTVLWALGIVGGTRGAAVLGVQEEREANALKGLAWAGMCEFDAFVKLLEEKTSARQARSQTMHDAKEGLKRLAFCWSVVYTNLMRLRVSRVLDETAENDSIRSAETGATRIKDLLGENRGKFTNFTNADIEHLRSICRAVICTSKEARIQARLCIYRVYRAEIEIIKDALRERRERLEAAYENLKESVQACGCDFERMDGLELRMFAYFEMPNFMQESKNEMADMVKNSEEREMIRAARGVCKAHVPTEKEAASVEKVWEDIAQIMNDFYSTLSIWRTAIKREVKEMEKSVESSVEEAINRCKKGKNPEVSALESENTRK